MNKSKFLSKKYTLIYLLIFSVIVVSTAYFLIYKKFEDKAKLNLTSVEDREKELSREISSNQRKIKDTIQDWDYSDWSEFMKGRVIEKETPESWEKYENDSISFYYPTEKYKVLTSSDSYTNKITLASKGESEPRKASEWTVENWNHEEWRRDGIGHDIDIEIKNLDSAAFEEEAFDLTFKHDWFGISNARLRKQGVYQINGKDVNLYFIESVERSDFSYARLIKQYKAQYFPRKEYYAIYKGKLNLYIIKGTSDINESTEDFVNNIEGVIGSLEEKGTTTKQAKEALPSTGSYQLTKEGKSEKEIGTAYLDAAKGVPSVGNSNSSKKVVIISSAINIDSVSVIPNLEKELDTSEVEILYLPTYQYENKYGDLPPRALLCADKESKFIEFRDKLNELAGKELKSEEAVDTIKGIAKDLGVDDEKLYKCIYSTETNKLYSTYTRKIFKDIGVIYDPSVILIQDGERVGEYWGYVGVSGLIDQMKKNPDSVWR